MTPIQKREYDSIVSAVQRLRAMSKEALFDENTAKLQNSIQKLASSLSPKEDAQTITKLRTLYKAFDTFEDVTYRYDIGAGDFIRALANFR